MNAGLSVAVSLFTLPALAAPGDVVFSETFDTKESLENWTIVDGNGGRTWEWLNGAASYMLDYQTHKPGDDWLISPAFTLDETKVYALTFHMDIASRTENLRVLLGTSTDTTSFTKVLADYPGVVKADSGDKTIKVYVKAGGQFRLAFYAYSEADMHRIDIDNVKITELSDAGAPGKVTGLTLTRGEKGALKASLAFNAPAVTANDEKLDGNVTVDVYRNGGEKAVKTFDDVKPGEALAWTDDEPGQGFNSYSVVVSNARGRGEAVEKRDFIGADTPEPVSGLKARLNKQRGIDVTWSAPKASVNGGYVDFGAIRYNIYRGDTKIISATADTSLTDPLPVDEGQAAVTYKVEPVAGSQTGEAVTSGAVVTGQPLKLPYHESFAGQHYGSPWSQDADVHDFDWQLMPDDEDGEYEEVVSQDHDGGILRADSKTAGQGEQSRFISPLLDLSTVSNPVMTFWFYYARSQWYDPDYDGEINDNVKIQISNDAGEWQDVENATFRLNDNSNGWTKCEVYLPRQTGSFVNVGLLATADAEAGAWRNIYIDNITIDESSYATDLALDSFTVNERRASVGDTVVYKATVYNRSANAVSEYSVDLYRDGEKVATLPGKAVEPAEKVSVEYAVVATLDDAQAEQHVWKAEIVFDEDELSENNVSEPLTTSVRKPEVPAVEGLTGVASAGGASLSWTAASSAPAVEHGERRHVTDDFESYEPFIIDGIGDWTVYDGDKSTTLVTPRIPVRYPHEGEPMAFQVFDNVESGTWVEDNLDQPFEAHSGKRYLVCPSADYPAENDDWLITPRLDGRSQTISFWAHSATYDLEWFNVYCSTTDSHHDSFTKLNDEDHISAGEGWRQYSFEVPEGTRYFAVRCVRRSVMFFVDDFEYDSYDGATAGYTLKGYNVYRDGGKITPRPVTENSYVDTTVKEGETHTYKVTAVYAEGESDYSAPVEVLTSGIAGTPAATAPGTVARYNLAGQRTGQSVHGVNIVKYSDGTIWKEVRK